MKYHIASVDTSSPAAVRLLTDLQKTCLPSDSVYPPTEGFWYVVYSGNREAVGFAGIVASSRWTDCMYLCRAGILHAHQGQGLQARLIRARVLKAKALGMNWVITDTYENPASSNNLIRCGFKLFDPLDPWGDKGTLFWQKRL
jgi:GNAT superfamily N-acetyltransferase